MGHSTYVVYIRSSMVDWLTLKISPLVVGFALGAYVIMEQPLQDFFVFVEEDVVVSRDSAPMTVCP